MSDPSAKATAKKPETTEKSKTWSVVQLLLSLAIVVAFLLRLIFAPHSEKDESASAKSGPAPAVQVIDEGRIRVDRESPLAKRMLVQKVEPKSVTDPLLRVTGRVIASRRPGVNGKQDYWQFQTEALLDAFSAWEKATADIQFTDLQLTQTRDLVTTKELAMGKAVERLERLVKSGTESERDLASQKAELLQTQIQDRKDLYQAELAVKTANREATTLTLQLLQSGIDPEMLKTATSDMDIITAEVPEAMLGRVQVGQSCVAKFFGLADQVFEGKVTSLSPVLSSEQRTLRVVFIIRDPADRLRPGMFASIGLGTDPRNVVRIPAASVIHVGRRDFVLVEEEGKNTAADLILRPTEVEVAELFEGQVELHKGLNAGEAYVADNAILLQPLVVTSLRKYPGVAEVKTSAPAKEETVPAAEGTKP
ncbi:MAG: efflux RND transporter periplasmic adaptor subunit [Planctomycetaceae bacterium]